MEFWKFGILELLGPKNLEIWNFGNLEFWNLEIWNFGIWNFGIVRPQKFGNVEFWNFGIVRPQDFGVLDLSALKILES